MSDKLVWNDADGPIDDSDVKPKSKREQLVNDVMQKYVPVDPVGFLDVPSVNIIRISDMFYHLIDEIVDDVPNSWIVATTRDDNYVGGYNDRCDEVDQWKKGLKA